MLDISEYLDFIQKAFHLKTIIFHLLLIENFCREPHSII